MREMWGIYVEEWSKKKEKVWGKLEDLEKGFKEKEKEGMEELSKIEEKLERLSILEKRMEKLEEMEEKRVKRSEAEESIVGELKMERRLEEIEKKIEGVERDRRKDRIVVKGVEMERGMEKEELEKIMKDIRVEVQIKGIRVVGGDNKEKPRV